jgi:hypothetical protein
MNENKMTNWPYVTSFTWVTLAYMDFISICSIRPSICAMSESFNVKFSFFGFMAVKNKIFKLAHPIFAIITHLMIYWL